MLIFEEHFVSGSICEIFVFSLFSKVTSVFFNEKQQRA